MTRAEFDVVAEAEVQETELGVGNVRLLDEAASKDMLTRAGVAVPERFTCDFDNAAAVVRDRLSRLAPPFVVKALSDEVIHKAKAGGVVLPLRTDAEVLAAMRTIRERFLASGLACEEFLVESMVKGNLEIIVGGIRDKLFGPSVAVGLGGALAEALGQIRFGLVPLTRSDVLALIDDVDAFAGLMKAGAIGNADRESLADILIAIGGPDGILAAQPEVQELDVNPVILSAAGAVAVDAAVILGDTASSPEESSPEVRAGDRGLTAALDLTRLLAPRAVAVVGASASGIGPGNNFLRNLTSQNYQGSIYVVHRTATHIQGHECVPRLEDIPEFVDYCFVSVAAAAVPDMVRAASGRVGFIQIMSSGFGEAADGQEVNRHLIEAIQASTVRVIGPNCLGTYSPKGGLSFVGNAPREPGHVGILSQSGGLAADIINIGRNDGMTFSAVVSLGNCVDLGPVDFVRHFLADDETSVIGMYLEDAYQARELFDVLRGSAARKPIVLLRGGTTPAGQVSAASHTGALSGEEESWRGWARQCGVLQVSSLREFVQTLRVAETVVTSVAAECSNEVILLGNGGGCSVLAADSVSRAGLALHAWSPEARAALVRLPVPPGMSVANPIDVPATALVQDDGLVGDVFDIIGAERTTPWVVAHLNLSVVRDNMMDPEKRVIAFAENVAKLAERGDSASRIVLVLRSDGSADCDQLKRLATTAVDGRGIPIFSEIDDALIAMRNMVRILQMG